MSGKVEQVNEKLLGKLLGLGILTDDESAIEDNPTSFEYQLFDDHDTHQVCKTVYFEVTNKCNFDCVHCYADMKRNGDKYLDINTFNRYLEQLGDDLHYDIRLTGGEPFLNPYIDELIDMVADKVNPYVRHSIVTNGSFDIKSAIHALEKGFEIQVSIYGMKESTFEVFARTDKIMMKKVFDNLEQLSNTEYCNQIVLLLSINSYTYEEIDEFVKYAEGLGFKPMLNRPASIGRAVQNWELLRLSPEQHLCFNRFNRHLVKGYNRYCYHACRLTWSYIDIYGGVKPCAFIRDTYNFGNLNNNNLVEIRNTNAFNEFKNFNASSFEKCNECEFKYACTGGCCGETLAYTGDMLKSYPWCKIKPYENHDYLVVNEGELYQVTKYAGGTFDFDKVC